VTSILLGLAAIGATESTSAHRAASVTRTHEPTHGLAFEREFLRPDLAAADGLELSALFPLLTSGSPTIDSMQVIEPSDVVSQGAAPPRIDAAAGASTSSFRLSVPFRTQKDGERFQGSNCGPAALAMVLEAFGMVYTNTELRWLTHTYQGTAGARGGTAIQHMARVGQDFGLNVIGPYDGQDFARWTIDDIRAELRAGRPVIPLVKYRLLPGHEESTVRFDHYIVIHGMDGDSFLYHDPAYESPWEGAARWIDASQLRAAMAVSYPNQQAVSFDSGPHQPLAMLGVYRLPGSP
jgi:hypothetical protein